MSMPNRVIKLVADGLEESPDDDPVASQVKAPETPSSGAPQEAKRESR